jgi:stearoyl-CoA desaturase (delta-9 desaturase)
LVEARSGTNIRSSQPGDRAALGAVGDVQRIDWPRVVIFAALHAACLLVFVVGTSPIAVTMAIVLYAVRMFALTGFYHRYFGHRAFRTSRPVQFVFAALAASALHRGPIYWAALHRHHHATSDQEGDAHSPVQRGLLWSHMGWFLSQPRVAPDLARVRDLSRFPELRALERYDILAPITLTAMLFALGATLEGVPTLRTDRWQMVTWGFLVSTLSCFHASLTINSLAHRFGTRRYDTPDDSRNNFWLALLTFGEGWHNNHHRYPGSARQGFFWWEVDITYYGLRALSMLGIVWDLKPVPARARRPGDMDPPAGGPMNPDLPDPERRTIGSISAIRRQHEVRSQTRGPSFP